MITHIFSVHIYTISVHPLTLKSSHWSCWLYLPMHAYNMELSNVTLSLEQVSFTEGKHNALQFSLKKEQVGLHCLLYL